MGEKCPDELLIEGQKYVRADSIASASATGTTGPFVVIRTKSAGVHVGELASRTGDEVVLRNSRRIWYWRGAASLSQLALEGVKVPLECKFSMVVPKITVFEVIEVIPMTEEARQNIYGVPVWKN